MTMTIDYNKLYELGTKKRSGEVFYSWMEIGHMCGMLGPGAGERARSQFRRMQIKDHTDDTVPANNQISFFDKIDEIAEKQLDNLSNNLKCATSGYIQTVDDTNNELPKSTTSTATLYIADDGRRKCHSVSYDQDGTITDDNIIDLSPDEITSPEVLLEKHGFDPEKFDLVRAKNTEWDAQTPDGIETLYSSKITVKPKENAITLSAIEEAFKRFSVDRNINAIPEPCQYNKNGKMLEVNIADLHLGKLGLESSCGSAYNIEIAKKRFYSVINDVIAKTNGYTFEKILFVFSNDFFNYDTHMYTTSHGTPQSHDTYWQELFLEGCNMLTNAIEMLARIAPVETFYVGANHDKQTSYYLLCYLGAWFREYPNVIVDVSPMPRKIRTFGRNLIYFCHGDIPKKQLNGLLAKEYPVEWGQARFREIHAAHLHSEQSIIEDCGCICRFLPSVTGVDTWHYENGYIGTVIKSQSFIWDKEFGLENIINSTIID